MEKGKLQAKLARPRKKLRQRGLKVCPALQIHHNELERLPSRIQGMN